LPDPKQANILLFRKNTMESLLKHAVLSIAVFVFGLTLGGCKDGTKPTNMSPPPVEVDVVTVQGEAGASDTYGII
jgi:hypothetical protein